MDFFVFFYLNSLPQKIPFISYLAIFFAEYFQYFLGFYFLALFSSRTKRNFSIVLEGLIAVLSARFLVGEFIYLFYRRTRPFVDRNVNLLISFLPEPSFPSGHALFFFSLSTVVYFYNKKAGIIFFVASFLISISRVICGVHWPSDILSGAIFGVISGLIIHFLFLQASLNLKKESQR